LTSSPSEKTFLSS